MLRQFWDSGYSLYTMDQVPIWAGTQIADAGSRSSLNSSTSSLCNPVYLLYRRIIILRHCKKIGVLPKRSWHFGWSTNCKPNQRQVSVSSPQLYLMMRQARWKERGRTRATPLMGWPTHVTKWVLYGQGVPHLPQKQPSVILSLLLSQAFPAYVSIWELPRWYTGIMSTRSIICSARQTESTSCWPKGCSQKVERQILKARK